MSCGTTTHLLISRALHSPSTQDHRCAEGEAEGGEDGSSNRWIVFSFFASQSLHKRNFLTKKFLPLTYPSTFLSVRVMIDEGMNV
jgi:hypothetical protein